MPQTVFYKGKDQDFSVIIENKAAVEKFRKGDHSLPLIDIVGIYKVFVSQRGTEASDDEASKQDLENEFGTSNRDEVIKKILTEGEFNTLKP
ncbi:hypothetical protein DIURU_003048 [Diutina rugosa]|uniref:Ribosome maturation protein SDO1/SBDS N-terminal domain-containing protein n=1 Tax=Diutina rugosa TaxID=5481 RepID=A0A642USC2_DIURU|nr:uncharacterized protein DIURU_003048 [Diutina rugosa]KAA8901997.1 hypothetical protein DIURU_003048 [Diutina rugosa]